LYTVVTSPNVYSTLSPETHSTLFPKSLWVYEFLGKEWSGRVSGERVE